MRYLIKERVFSFADKFIIKDESGRSCYEVAGKVFSIGNKLDLYDMQGNSVMHIEQKLLKFLPEYTIYKGGSVIGKVKKEFTLLRPKFIIESIYGDLTIEGNVIRHDFEILKNGRVIAVISKMLMSFSDTYLVDIVDQEDQAFVLALVIVLDQIFHDDRNKKS